MVRFPQVGGDGRVSVVVALVRSCSVQGRCGRARWPPSAGTQHLLPSAGLSWDLPWTAVGLPPGSLRNYWDFSAK